MAGMATATKATANKTATTLPQQASPQYAFPIKEITPLPDYRLKVVFSNGIQGTVDFSWVLEAPAFERVRDPAEFAKVHVSSQGYIMFGEDLDVAWEPVYEKLSGKPWWTAEPPDTWKILRLVSAQWAAEPPLVWVEFNNGVEGEVALDGFASGEEPLEEYVKGPDELVVTAWGDIVCGGVEYDSGKIFQHLTGEDLDKAEERWNA